MNIWDAEFEVSEALATRLIEGQFPDLAPARLAHFGAGWDNVAYLVNGAFVFRFPRRKVAVPLIETEVGCLTRIGPALPLPVPIPIYRGAPTDAFPYPFAGYRLLPGTTACRVRWTDAERRAIAAPIAGFLRALHKTPLDAELLSIAPPDQIGRTDMARRSKAVLERLARIAELSLADFDLGGVCACVTTLAQTPPYTREPVLLHGDLYARHLLVDSEKRPAGVIDWGDIHRGDPALDLSLGFSFLPASARADFRAAYGPIDSGTWDRARFRAFNYAGILTLYGADQQDDAIRDAGIYALHAAMED